MIVPYHDRILYTLLSRRVQSSNAMNQLSNPFEMKKERNLIQFLVPSSLGLETYLGRSKGPKGFNQGNHQPFALKIAELPMSNLTA